MATFTVEEGVEAYEVENVSEVAVIDGVIMLLDGEGKPLFVASPATPLVIHRNDSSVFSEEG